jgi:uncharacterized membrane protein YcaP (DUF421 family)
MSKDDIKLDDWYRILIGEVPAGFFLEALIRISCIYILLMLSMRLMGKRMSSQLNRNELAAMVTIAAAIGIPLQSAERGLIPAVIICLVVVLVQRSVSRWAGKNERFEKLSQGNIACLVRDGTLLLKNMEAARITRERLLAHLRSKGMKNLGGIRRVYIEANGVFSMILGESSRAGLPTIPQHDHKMLDKLTKEEGASACYNCGYVQKCIPERSCDNCNSNHWVEAVKG